jgi:hypothetical protein
MSAFLPIVKKDNKVFVVIDGGNKELSNKIDVYKKVTYDGKPNEPPKEYYGEDGMKVETPQIGAGVFLKLGKHNENTEMDDNFQDNTFYIKNNDVGFLVGGRKPKRLSHLSKKRAMKSRRIRKSKRRYSRRN